MNNELQVRTNILASLRLFDMAKEFKHLGAYIHVSTAYVNADRGGFHEETLPPLNFKPEEMIQVIS